MLKKIFIDVETTGVDPERHGLIEIAGIIEYENVYEEFDFFLDTFTEDEIQQEALDKHGYTEEDIAKFPDPFDVHEKLIKILDKHIDRYKKEDKFFFFGYFAEFDYKFLRMHFQNVDDKFFGSWFYFPWIDVAQFAAVKLMGERNKIKSFSLSNMADYLGIKVKEKSLHGALYDIKLTKRVYDRLGGV